MNPCAEKTESFVIMFQGKTFSKSKKDKWSKQHSLRNLVDTRNPVTFFGEPISSVQKSGEEDVEMCSSSSSFSSFARSLPAPRCPNYQTEEDQFLDFCRWDDILRHSEPREYQLAAFVEVLRQNTLLVLPTGITD